MNKIFSDKRHHVEILFYLFIIGILTVFAFAFNTIDPDYWARLMQGQFFLETGNIMRNDIFSYIPTHSWIDHEWGSSIVFAIVQKYLGFKGIFALRIIIEALIFFFIFKTIKIRTGKNDYILNLLFFFAALTSLTTLVNSGLRCHFFTFLFFTIFVFITEKARKENKYKPLAILPFIMLIWSNMHAGCVSGLGLLLLYAIGEAINKKRVKPFIYTTGASLAVLFVNPYGIKYVVFTFLASTMQRPGITEWISPFLNNNPLFMLEFKIIYVLFLLLTILKIKDIKKDVPKYLLLLACAIISAKSVKSAPFFIITGMIFLSEYFLSFFELIKSKTKYFTVSAKIILITGILFYSGFEYYQNRDVFFLDFLPYRTVEFFEINDLNGKILAPFEYGSYIAYKRYPHNLIFMDGRYEEVYYRDEYKILTDFYSVNKDWEKILEIKPDYIIIPRTALLNDMMQNRNDYKPLYVNDADYIYASTDILKDDYKMPEKKLSYYKKNAFKTHFAPDALKNRAN